MFEKVEQVIKQYNYGVINVQEAIQALDELRMECDSTKISLAITDLIIAFEKKAYEDEAKRIRDLEKLI